MGPNDFYQTTCTDTDTECDSFDCDPFQQLGCDACIAEGGRYCEAEDGTPLCSSPEIAATVPNICLGSGGGTPFVADCADLSTPPTDGECDIFNDPCQYVFDLVCDDPSGLNFCPANSDCFDCDPFQQFRNQGCAACIAEGGRYCEAEDGTPLCSAPEIAATIPNICFGSGGGTPFVADCADLSTPPTDGECDILNDPCPFTLDLECDDPSGLDLCPPNSDCFDCDPFLELYRFLGCDGCIEKGGRYCETFGGVPVCSSPEIAATVPGFCSDTGGSDYVSTCSGFEPPPTSGDCDILNDPCFYPFDLECDDPSGLNLCPANSDCFDCDPFQQFRSWV